MSMITCTNASFSYDGRSVLEQVDFSLSAGDYLCIVGENGSGKSTLIKGILGLKHPDKGSIEFGEELKPTPFPNFPFSFLLWLLTFSLWLRNQN